MGAPGKQVLTVDEEYMAGLLTEELCGDCSPLSDCRVEAVSQNEDGSFEIVMALNKKGDKE